MNIYVSNLSFKVQDEDLKKLFQSMGDVSSARIVLDRETERSRGFGFVEMPNDEEAEAAIQKLNGSMVEGRAISVTVARPKAPRNDNFQKKRNSW